MNSPLIWFGGKGPLTHKLIPLLPPHITYVEPFAGGASLFFAKKPSPVEVLNDLHGGLVNFYRVLRDPAKFETFARYVSLTPYARQEYLDCRATWEVCEDEVERAARFFVMARMAFSGNFHSTGWCHSVTHSNRGKAGAVSKWLSGVEGLPAVHRRLISAQVECLPALECIQHYDTPDTLFYLDPPYIADTRRSGEYNYEMDDAAHRALVDMLLNIQGTAILSGYAHALYQPLELAGWERQDWDVTCWAAATTRDTGLLGTGAKQATQRRVESVWIHPPRPTTEAASIVMNFYPLSLARRVTRCEIEPIYCVIGRCVLYVGQTSQPIGRRLAQHCNRRKPSELGGRILSFGDDASGWHVLTMRVEEIEVDWSLIRWNFHQAPLDVKMELFFNARQDNPYNEFNRFVANSTLHSYRSRAAITPYMKHQFKLWDTSPPDGWEQTWIRRLDAKLPVDRAECFLIMLHNPPLNSTFNYSTKKARIK